MSQNSLLRPFIQQEKSEKGKWRCAECHFDNYLQLLCCQICQTQKPPQEISKKVHSDLAESIQCKNKECKKMNPLDIEYCLDCATPLFEEQRPLESKPEKVRINKDLIKCYNCKLQNDKMYKKCLNCNKPLVVYAPPAPFSLFGPRPPLKPRHCERCHNLLQQINLATGDYQICDCQLEESKDSEVCSFCDTKISHQDKKKHSQTCQKRLQFFDRHKNPSFDRCSKLQAQTMLYMQKKCEKLHLKYKKAILKKIRALGFTEEDLENLQHYIIHYAPIIVHMRANMHYEHFLKDTHYRNAFEIHKGVMGAGGRVTWEDRMFDNHHHHATPFERVKYGTMNFTNDPKGVSVASGYGQSYFLLKPHVRDRCTITDMDSASATATLGTFRFVNHLLMKLSDNEIRAAIQGSKGKEMLSNVIHAYKEIQIHGPLEFSKDVERVYLSRAQLTSKTIKDSMQLFCQNNKLQFEQFAARNAAGMHGGGLGPTTLKTAHQRFIDKKQTKEDELEQEERFSKKTIKKRYRR